MNRLTPQQNFRKAEQLVDAGLASDTTEGYAMLDALPKSSGIIGSGDLITLAPHLDAIMKHAATGAATLAALSTSKLGESPNEGVYNQWDLNLLASLGFFEPGYMGSARQAYSLTAAGRVYCRLKGYAFHE